MTGITPGPWEWMGNDLSSMYLATTHSGRRYVMGFKRRGMQGAEPMFQVDGRMVGASELVRMEVAPHVRGFRTARAHPDAYRYDICGIDHPDALAIRAAPDLLAAARSAYIEAGRGIYGGTDTMPPITALASVRGILEPAIRRALIVPAAWREESS